MREEYSFEMGKELYQKILDDCQEASMDWHSLSPKVKENFVRNFFHQVFEGPSFVSEPYVVFLISRIDLFAEKIDRKYINNPKLKPSKGHDFSKTNKFGLKHFEFLMFLLSPSEKEELQAYLFDYRREMDEKGYVQWKINLITLGNILRVVVPKLFSAIWGLVRVLEKLNIG